MQSVAHGTITTIVGTEVSLAQSDLNGVFVLEPRLNNMAPGDVFEFRLYTMCLAAGALELIWKGTVGPGKPISLKPVTPPVISDLLMEATVTQLAGAARSIDWKILSDGTVHSGATAASPAGGGGGTPPPTVTTLVASYTDEPGDSDFQAQFDSWTSGIGHAPTAWLTFLSGDYTWDDGSFGWVAACNYYANAGKAETRTANIVPIVAWPMGTSVGGNQDYYSGMAAGTYDAAITSGFDQWKAAGYTKIYVRLGWEWNISGNIWGVTNANYTEFVAAWKHFADLAHAYVGMTIKMVWNPNVAGNQNGDQIALTNLYPGDAYVDVIAIDSYGAPVDSGDPPNQTSTDPAFATILGLMDMATSHGKTFAMGECGGIDQTFITSLGNVLQAATVPIEFIGVWDHADSQDLSWSSGASSSAPLIAAYKAAFGPFFSSPGFTYYVDPAGSDAADGTTAATAWKTLAKVNAATLTPGQSVGLKAGGIWRETLIPGQGGTSAAPIRFGSYGTGSAPVIAASDTLTWTQGSGAAAQESGGLFVSGMETASLSDWTVYATDIPVAQSTAFVAHGTYSAAIGPGVASGNRGYLGHTFTPAIDTSYYFRFYFYYPSGSLTASQSVKVFTIGGGAAIFCHIDTDASGVVTTLTFYDSTHSAQYASGAVTLPPDTWNYVEFEVTYSATVGGGQAWVNGVSVGSNFTVNNSSSAGVSAEVQVGLSGFASDLAVGAYVYLDDFKMATSGPIGGFSAGTPATVWYAAQATDPLFPIINGLPGTKVGGVGSVTASGQYYWDGSTIYVYSVSDPASAVEIPARSNAITVSGKSYLTFESLSWRGATANGLEATGQVSGMTVNGCTIELCYIDGWRLIENTATVSDITLTNNAVRYNGSSGFNHNCSYTQNCTITGNQIHNNAQVPNGDADHTFMGGWKGFSQAFNVDTTASPCGTGFLISNNTVYNNGRSPTGEALSATVGANGLWPDTMADVTIANNTVYGNTGHGVFLEKNYRSIAKFNISYNNAYVPYVANLTIKCSDGNNANASAMYHNTSYGGYWGIYCGAYEGNGASNLSNCIWENNIAIGATAGQNLYVDVGGNNNSTNGSGNIYNHNCFGAAAANFAFWAPNMVSDYATLDTDYGSAMDNVQADPQFTNAGSADFTLQAGSPCIGAGINVPGISPSPTPNVGAL